MQLKKIHDFKKIYNWNRSKLLIIIVFIFLILITACTEQAKSPTEQVNQKLTIVTTFYPLSDIARNIAGDQAVVSSFIPAGVEPHDYEPTPQDIIKLQSADIYVTMGIEFAPFETKLLSSINGKDSKDSINGKNSINKNVNIINTANGILLLDINKNTNNSRTDEDINAEQSLTGKDPHIWLSPKNMILMANQFNSELSKLYPEKAQIFANNTAIYIQKLTALDGEFQSGLKNCKKHTILTNHDAFAYLGKEYGFTQFALSGLKPEKEPTPQTLKKLIDIARENNIKYVFYEELVDPRIADAVANEIHATPLELNPLEGTKDPIKNDYFVLMKKNLYNLELALECSEVQ